MAIIWGGKLKTVRKNIQRINLLKIKKIIDDDDDEKFNIVRTKKNMSFMRTFNLTKQDVKDIIRCLSVDDCFSGPERDRDSLYDGWIFKFSPMFEDIKLYIKIRVENNNKAICISIHEFGLYDEVK